MEKGKNFNWCFKTGRGLKLIECNENLVKVYLRKSKSALNMLDSAIEKNELEWILDTSYYARYFSIYALFMKIGIKCEIHSCTIFAFKKLFVEEKICPEEFHKEIEESKELRIDALYYEKDIGKENIMKSAEKTPDFCLEIEKIIKDMTDNQINQIRSKFITLKKL